MDESSFPTDITLEKFIGHMLAAFLEQNTKTISFDVIGIDGERKQKVKIHFVASIEDVQ